MQKHLYFLFLVLPFFAFSQINRPKEIKGYELQIVNGSKVYVETKAMTEHSTETQAAIQLLKNKLIEIDEMAMLKDAKERLKSVPFFIDWNLDANKAAEYHPNRDWLIEHGYAPEKAKSVNIVNVNNFLNWTKQNQPYMVLHELAHSYHDLTLSYGNADILAAYQNIMNERKLESVSYNNGTSKEQKRAYAANDEKEYFAEITEAYWGKNDYYPFNRKDLAEYDPKGYALMQNFWQDPNNVQPVPIPPQPVIPPAPASNNLFDETKYYRFTTKWQGDDKALDVVNDGKDNNKLQLAKKGNYSGQYWKIAPLGNGYYRLTTKWQGDDKALDVVNDGKDNNKLNLAKKGNYSGQYWKIEPLGNEYYRLTTKWQGDDKALDVVNDGKENNKLQLAKKGSYSGQYWKIVEIK